MLTVRVKEIRAILFCLLFALSASCAKAPSDTTRLPDLSDNPLAIWRAPESNISNRLTAAQQLLTVGMNIRDVENTLGEPSRRNRHNPGLSLGTPPDKSPRIRWWYDYRFPDGIITVRFLQVMDADIFDAEYQSICIGSEPVMIPMQEVKKQRTSP